MACRKRFKAHCVLASCLMLSVVLLLVVAYCALQTLSCLHFICSLGSISPDWPTMVGFTAVSALSDDEPGGGPISTPARAVSLKLDESTEKVTRKINLHTPLLTPSVKKGKLSQSQLYGHGPGPSLISKTRSLVQSKCRCCKSKTARNCFEPFREPGKFTLLSNHLRNLHRLDKMELDKEAGFVLHMNYTLQKNI